MPRLTQVPRSGSGSFRSPVLRRAVWQRSRPVTHPVPLRHPGNWWTVFAHVPDCLLHMVAGLSSIETANARSRRGCENWGRPGQATREAVSSCSRSTARPYAPQSFQRRKLRLLPTGPLRIYSAMWNGPFWPTQMTWCCRVVASATAHLLPCRLISRGSDHRAQPIRSVPMKCMRP